MDANTSRILLLPLGVNAASHANQTTLSITPQRGRADVFRRLIGTVGSALPRG